MKRKALSAKEEHIAKLWQDVKVFKMSNSLSQLNEEMILTGLLNGIKAAETSAIERGYPLTAIQNIWVEDKLVFEWRISVNTNPRLKKQGHGYLKIEGRMYYSDEDLYFLQKQSMN